MKYDKEFIDSFLLRGKEGEFWDFKQEWHDKIEDLMKDIICFSNTVHDKDCYIIFGVADDLTVTGMEKPRKKQADILDAMSNLSFAGSNSPKISVEKVLYDEIELDVLVVYNQVKTPIFLERKYGNMIQGCIYSRVGDRNTPNNGNAKIEIIEKLWKKRFGLIKSPLEDIFYTLENKQDWILNEEGNYYNKYRPKYTMIREYSEFQGAEDFYSYVQINKRTSQYIMKIMSNNTILKSFSIVSLDSGRLSIPKPESEFIYFDSNPIDGIEYIYYIKDSHIELLLRFMYDKTDHEQNIAFRRLEKLTLFFESENEKRVFKEYIESNKDIIKKKIDSRNDFDYIKTDCESLTKKYKYSLRLSIVLKQMLDEFRKVDY